VCTIAIVRVVSGLTFCRVIACSVSVMSLPYFPDERRGCIGSSGSLTRLVPAGLGGLRSVCGAGVKREQRAIGHGTRRQTLESWASPRAIDTSACAGTKLPRSLAREPDRMDAAHSRGRASPALQARIAWSNRCVGRPGALGRGREVLPRPWCLEMRPWAGRAAGASPPGARSGPIRGPGPVPGASCPVWVNSPTCPQPAQLQRAVGSTGSNPEHRQAQAARPPKGK